MKLRPPLRMAGAVLVLYAFLAVFFQRGVRRTTPPEPIVTAESPGILADPGQGYRIIPAGAGDSQVPHGNFAPGPFGGVKIGDVSATESSRPRATRPEPVSSGR
jgi:hypothetical protein